MTTNRENLIKMVKFRAWRRGFKEADYMFGGFVNMQIEELSDTDIALFLDLLQRPDWEVYNAVVEGKTLSDPKFDHLLRKLQNFAYLQMGEKLQKC